MGACCSKFGTYFVRKEEGKGDNGTTPKLNKLEHKTSFIEDKVNGLDEPLLDNKVLKLDRTNFDKFEINRIFSSFSQPKIILLATIYLLSLYKLKCSIFKSQSFVKT
jgi:hypothetical protein